MLTHACAGDLSTHARSLGLKLDAPLRDGRLVLLKYRPDVVHNAALAVSSNQAVADLERLIAAHGSSRVIVDTIAPFLAGDPPVGGVVAAIAEMLERVASTSVLTFSEDLATSYDRSLEPLVQRASGVIRLVREDANIRRAELVNIRYTPPPSAAVRFVIRRDVGIVAEHPVRAERVALRVP
jgi:KaiC/GvpD/RAD55 family RecA-like ATPase